MPVGNSPTTTGTCSVHDLTSPALSFDETDIRRCLAGSFDKGRSYQREGAVRDLRADKGGQRLIASVHGTRPRPYHVFVEIEDSEPVSLTARCTCPVGWNCKHAAAVLFEALRKPPPIQQIEQDPLSGAVGGWLHQLRAAAHPPALAGGDRFIVSICRRGRVPPFALDLRVVRILKSGDLGRRSGIARCAAAEPDGELPDAGRPRDHSAAARRRLEYRAAALRKIRRSPIWRCVG